MRKEKTMTINELQEEVAALGFEDSIACDTPFITAANRALRTIYTERPVARRVRIPTSKVRPLSRVTSIRHEGGDVITLTLTGSCYAFRVQGQGKFTFENGIVVENTEFYTEDSLFRGFIRGGSATITFSGEEFFTVYNLVTYKERFGGVLKAIKEFTPFDEYDLKSLYGDYLAHLELPTDEAGEPLLDAVIDSGVIRLPTGKYDEIYVRYARMPKEITPEDTSAEVDIFGDVTPLLPILTAAYLWLDDDAERAEYYMSLYRTEMSLIRRYNTNAAKTGYRDVLGWA